ncbi:restriction endonuclease subunit S [Vibrio diazotrophicus]|uniref:Restriction endonuclease subunit S n=1 Tax=Vibrio diazotrophicus TaxID=685 RepID=A0A2J8I6X0_VIBDI|nr:restriction endonuclease subunit S [Vibrio diazotrophicus]PNI06241.1 restriction endonuclease subunit S [Vibrio diazotrophicus]
MADRNAKHSSYLLSEIACIQTGFPFRGQIKDKGEEGTVAVVQPKDVSHSGIFMTDNLLKTHLSGRKKPDWLEVDDILFIAKGVRKMACCVTEKIENTVCSPNLYQIRINPAFKQRINPEFLSWQINQQTIQNYLTRGAEGSGQTAIRKPVLEATPVIIPDIKKQEIIVKMHRSAVKEAELLQSLIDNRQQQLNAIANNLTNFID